ncbi:alpha-ketoglutarate-dependent dioxygenase AlkB [Rhodococcus gannanensis]|uniref:Alpha-ketoglutarate-dependent dioxygenase AlkB n=1 Tax=Rhodococcus gannanensis TaxID=1960308 RepID=A0ABW4NYZ2_9NOCA
MEMGLQSSLFDDPTAGTRFAPIGGSVRRRHLSAGAWVDVLPGWLTGSDALLARLVDGAAWRAERRQMYDRVVDVPRLVAFYDEAATLPDPLLDEARHSLSTYYRRELGEPFATAGLCLYRDGNDSVAWHGDTIGRSATEDTMVAILSLGAARPLALRPRGTDAGHRPGGGEVLKFALGHGDLVVMGGSCQRTWEHAVPKTTRPTGPRISVQFRTRGVR